MFWGLDYLQSLQSPKDKSQYTGPQWMCYGWFPNLMVTSKEWAQTWAKRHGPIHWQAEEEHFRFGVGKAKSTRQYSLPIKLCNGKDYLPYHIQFSTVDVNISFLVSRSTLEALQAILDLAQKRLHVKVDGKSVTVPLVQHLGHLAFRALPLQEKAAIRTRTFQQGKP